MFKTTFLVSEDYNSKTFTSGDVLTNKNIARKLSKVGRVGEHFRNEMFVFSEGALEIKQPNQLYQLEHNPYKTDILLPKDPKFLEWVVLYYNINNIGQDLTIENPSKIKIYGNGKKIMGLDEPLFCDLVFSSLRLTYLNNTDGWIIN